MKATHEAIRGGPQLVFTTDQNRILNGKDYASAAYGLLDCIFEQTKDQLYKASPKASCWTSAHRKQLY